MKRLSAACLVALVPLASWAGIVPAGDPVIDTGAGLSTWSYRLQLASDADAVAGPSPQGNPVPHLNFGVGSFFTLFDLAGYVAGSCTGPQGWTCTLQDPGFTPAGLTVGDDGALPNLTWTYTTGPRLNGAQGVDLGVFGVQSVYGIGGLVSYAARGLKHSGASAGASVDNSGTVFAPSSLPAPALQAVPEPGALALAGLGLLLVAAMRPRAAGR